MKNNYEGLISFRWFLLFTNFTNICHFIQITQNALKLIFTCQKTASDVIILKYSFVHGTCDTFVPSNLPHFHFRLIFDHFQSGQILTVKMGENGRFLKWTIRSKLDGHNGSYTPKWTFFQAKWTVISQSRRSLDKNWMPVHFGLDPILSNFYQFSKILKGNLNKVTIQG